MKRVGILMGHGTAMYVFCVFLGGNDVLACFIHGTFALMCFHVVMSMDAPGARRKTGLDYLNVSVQVG